VKKLTAVFLLILFIFPVWAFAKNSPIEEQFKKSFPKNNFESITPTAVKGVYEVYTGNQLYYYLPKDDVILTAP